MRQETKAFWLCMALLALACAAVAYAEDGLADQKQTEKLVAKLAERNVTPDVRIIVVNPHVYGWYSDGTQQATIYIIDRGTTQNVKTALHELEHHRQHVAGEPYDEKKAYDAENK